MGVRVYENRVCVGCGIPLSDGYVLGCEHCTDRRRTRLRRGESETPTGYAGEVIDNTDPRGRLKLGSLVVSRNGTQAA